MWRKTKNRQMKRKKISCTFTRTWLRRRMINMERHVVVFLSCRRLNITSERRRGGSSRVKIGDKWEGFDVAEGEEEDEVGNGEWYEDGMVVSGDEDSGIATSEEGVSDSGLWWSKGSMELGENQERISVKSMYRR